MERPLRDPNLSAPAPSATVAEMRQRALDLFRAGRLEEAGASLEHALAIHPDEPELCNNLGVILAEQGHHEEALTYYDRALQRQPDYVHAQHNRGNALRRLGRLQEAVASYERAVRLQPQAANSWNNLGIALLALGRPAEAAESFRQALRVQPDHADAPTNLGVALAEQGHLAEATALYRQALRRTPGSAEAHNNLGVALAGQGQWDEAIICYRRALELKADYAEAYNNLGNALRQQGELTSAADALRQALHLRPGYAEACNNLAIVQVKQGEPTAALAAYDEAVRLQPDYAEAHVNRALAWLLLGDWTRGWPEYEWRGRMKDACKRSFRQPRWDGGTLEGRTILLYAEQGLGDTLQFIRYAPLVQKRGGVVLVEAQRALLPLLRSCAGIDQLLAAGAPLPAFDVQAPLLSLPGLLHTTLDTLPAAVPYLSAEPDRVERWGEELCSRAGLKIGIAWQGSPKYRDDRYRSIPLKHFEVLARLPEVRLVSLQKGFGREQLAAVARDWNVLDLADRLDEAGAFLDTSAILQHLDLVITSDTALAHLAGALGVPAWVVLPYACDWRWFLEREDSPWYPSLRLFRQKSRGDWDEVFARIAEELRWRRSTPATLRPATTLAATVDAADLHRQGKELCRQGQFAEAIACFRRALQVRPQAAATYNNLGIALRAVGQLDEAIACYRRAIELKVDYSAPYNNLGNALRQQGALDPAAEALQQALRLQPRYAEAHNNLAIIRVKQGDLPAALAGYEEAVRLQPDYADARANRALAWLLCGDFPRGWPEYEWRWRRKGTLARSFAQPRWDGAPLEGRTILLYAEQGLGDTLQFIRYAPLVQQRGGKVLVEAPPALLPLLRSCAGIDQLLPAGGPLPRFDVQTPLLSLPALFHTTLDTVPAAVPYLSAEPERVERWAAELQAVSGFRIGIAWQGSPKYSEDRHRSIPLQHFQVLARLPEVRLVSLQKGFGREQLAAVARDWNVLDLTDRLDEAGAFLDTAAILQHLDLVVTSDTALAHLAGALGVPAWVALPYACDWRWLRQREDNPWYPSLRLFRQKRIGDWKEVFARLAEDLHRRSSSASPGRMPADSPETYRRLGEAHAQRGAWAEAVDCYRRAVRARPEDADAQCRLGLALARQGHLDDAVACLRQALALRPEDGELAYHLGDVRRRQGQLPEAEAYYRQAVQRQPRAAHSHNHLGIAILDQGRPAEAEACFRHSIQCDPRHAPAHNNLAVALEQQGRLAEAIAAYQESLCLDSNQADTHKNLALARLLAGDFTQGWPEYEWRWKCPKAIQRGWTQPRWDGRALEGRTILLHAEQGLGDTLQFIRYAPLVQQRGGVVLVEAPGALLPLLRRCPGIDQLLPAGSPLPAFDVQAPFLSLPALFHTTLDTVPAAVPYLSAEPKRVERWAAELQAVPGFKIGIAWQGSRKYAGDKHRSIPLKHFEALVRLPGVRLVSLQKGFGREQLAAMAQDWNVLDFADRLDESGGAFLDTAAILQHLDLVVTSDTALVHLAGALAVPVWVALPVARDWRWLLDREDSPWYPTLRLFRQRRWGDWDEVFARIAAAVPDRQAGAMWRQPLRVEISPGELLDKIAILEIKRARLRDDAQRANVCVELGSLLAARARSLREPAELSAVTAALKAVNERFWDVEDELRLCERQEDFGPRFVQLARSVYRLNDERARLKRRINERCGSVLIEEKSYPATDAAGPPAAAAD